MKTAQQTRPLIDVADAAALLGVKPRLAYDLARRGLIPSVRLGRLVRFSPMELDRFIKSGGRIAERERERISAMRSHWPEGQAGPRVRKPKKVLARGGGAFKATSGMELKQTCADRGSKQ
jgi:excisionase family DNA binding protein